MRAHVRRERPLRFAATAMAGVTTGVLVTSCALVAPLDGLSGSRATGDDGPAHGDFWAKRYGDASDQQGIAVAFDVAGNLVVTGAFQGSIDFGAGAMTSAGGYDIFVAKIDPTGRAIWSTRFGDTADQRPYAVAVDSSGNVLVTGAFSGALDFGAGAMTSAGGTDAFLAKLDATGHAVWSKRFGDAQDQDGDGVAVALSGNVAATGGFAGTADFGTGAITSAGADDVWVAVYDATGKPLWSKIFGDSREQFGKSIAYAPGSDLIAITGAAAGTIDFGDGAQHSAGDLDFFVVELDPTGGIHWSTLVGDPLEQRGQMVTVDSGGNVLAVGHFAGSMKFGALPVLQSAGGFDAFVAKFDSHGGAAWARSWGDAADQFARGVAADGAQNVVVTGWLAGSMDIGTKQLTSAGLNDVFLVKLDPSGSTLWGSSYGDAADQRSNGIAVDLSAAIGLTGQEQGSIDFGFGPLTSSGANDVMLARLRP
jgi:hypothetical protein